MVNRAAAIVSTFFPNQLETPSRVAFFSSSLFYLPITLCLCPSLANYIELYRCEGSRAYAPREENRFESQTVLSLNHLRHEQPSLAILSTGTTVHSMRTRSTCFSDSVRLFW